MIITENSSEVLKIAPISALLRDSGRLYQERFFVFVGILLPPLVILGIASTLLAQEIKISVSFLLLSWLATFLNNLLVSFAAIALIVSIHQGTAFVESYRRAAALFFPYIWTSILASLAIAGGSILFFIPGILMSIWLAFYTYVVVIEGKWGFQALVQSREYARNHWWEILGRIAPFVILAIGASALYKLAATGLGNVTAAAVFVLLILLIAPLAVIYGYKLYENAVALRSSAALSVPSPGPSGKTIFVVTAIIGLLGSIAYICLAVFLINRVQSQFTSQAGGFYPVVLPSEAPNGSTSTAGWNTYTNTQYGFTFQYPQTFIFQNPNATHNANGKLVPLPNPDPIVPKVLQDPSVPGIAVSLEDLGFGILVNKKPQNFTTLKAWADQAMSTHQAGAGTSQGESFSVAPINVGGAQGFDLIQSYDSGVKNTYENIYLEQGDFFYIIQYSYPKAYTVSGAYIATDTTVSGTIKDFNNVFLTNQKILSTFKFIK